MSTNKFGKHDIIITGMARRERSNWKICFLRKNNEKQKQYKIIN
jgi:hypothetical protein